MLTWFKDAIIYEILIDRFAGYTRADWQKPEFMGGNIKGIISRLDYLKELGITVIWMTPFYQCSAYHGYHVTDFFQVEPRFGSLDDLKELIQECHSRGIRLIADFVPNHCSSQHPFFLEAKKNKNSPYFRWFYFTKWPDDFLCFLKVKELPKLNLGYAQAREHIINAAKYWLSLGIDGFRLDHVIGPSNEFWKRFRDEIKKDYPDAILIGEAAMLYMRFEELKTIKMEHKYKKWISGQTSDSILKNYVGILDGVLDFRFYHLMKQFAHGKLDEVLLRNKLKEHYSKYPEDYFLVSFLDNHDVNRFLFECGNDKEKLKKAAEIQFSQKQPLIIYYGTEAGMSQDMTITDFRHHGDLQARQTMKWEGQDIDLLDYYRDLIKQTKK